MTRLLLRFSPLYAITLALPLAFGLSACASMTDTPNQQVQVLTPGAEGAKCTLTTDYAKYVVHPPETIFMRRMQEPLKIRCLAPGNRERTTFAYPQKNGTALGNVITGGISAIYDHFSGALYKYPSPITIDFRHTIATKNTLPNYYKPDTVSPLDQKPEKIQGQATHPRFGDDPASLIEKDTEKDESKDSQDMGSLTDDSEKSSQKSPETLASPDPVKK